VLGIRGSEDLGGGMKVDFQLEGQLNSSYGNVGGSSNMFDRHSWVGVSGGFGSVKVGRTNTAMKDLDGFSDSGANLFDNEASDFVALNSRAANQVRYDSPAFAGVTVAISSSFSNAASAGTANANAGDEINAVRVLYSAGNLQLGVGAGEVKVIATTFKESHKTIGGSYNLGFAVVNAAYSSADTTATADVNDKSVGIALPLGAGVTIRANYAATNYSASDTADVKRAGVLVQKAMSKRTNIFAGYRADNFGSTTADSSLSAIGIQHSF
jgi:predicted porin